MCECVGKQVNSLVNKWVRNWIKDRVVKERVTPGFHWVQFCDVTVLFHTQHNGAYEGTWWLSWWSLGNVICGMLQEMQTRSVVQHQVCEVHWMALGARGSSWQRQMKTEHEHCLVYWGSTCSDREFMTGIITKYCASRVHVTDWTKDMASHHFKFRISFYFKCKHFS